MTPTQTTTSVELVKSLYAAFANGDIAFLLAHVAPECEWIVAGSGIPAAGHYNGPTGAAEFFRKLDETEEITTFEPWRYFTDGGDVVAYGHEECRMKATGATASTNWMMLFQVSEGMVTRFETFYDTSAYARAHGLAS